MITVGFVTSLFAQSVIPPGTDADVLTIEMCLRAGTAAGEYPLTIRAAELIAGCDDNGCGENAGGAIHPRVTHGTLVVPADVGAGADCEDRRPPPPPRVPLPDDEPEPPRIPPGLDLAAEIRIGSAEARPGEAVELPYIVNSTGAVQGFSFSIDFDEEVLEATEIEERFIIPDPLAVPFWVSTINNENETPGNGGIDEGYVVGGGIPDLHGVSGHSRRTWTAHRSSSTSPCARTRRPRRPRARAARAGLRGESTWPGGAPAGDRGTAAPDHIRRGGSLRLRGTP